MTVSASLQARYPRYIMVLIRLMFSYLWFEAASWKNPPTFGLYTGADFYYWVNNVVQHSRFTFGVSFFKAVVVPHFLFFGWVILLLEIALGISFLFGLKTRIFAAVVTVYTFFMYLGSFGIPGEWYWSYLLMTMVGLTLFAFDTSDTVLSVDHWLMRLGSRKKQPKPDAPAE